MNESAIIIERIRRKEAEIQTLDERIRAAKIYVQALQDVLNAIGRAKVDRPASDAALRAGSSVALAREVILRAAKPVHISDLLSAMGKGVTKEARASLASSLAAYVRRGEVFTRSAPNTFGLIELGHDSGSVSLPREPPAEFGEVRRGAEDQATARG